MDLQTLLLLPYSDEEKNRLNQLKQLFEEWGDYLSKETKLDPDLKKYLVTEGLTTDGFYPGYLNQKVKVLFIARESRFLSSEDYIQTLYNAIKANKVGELSLNRSVFHRRLIYLTYSLQNNLQPYEEIPYASELSGRFGTNDLSWAFMNLSKISNEDKNFQSKFDIITEFVEFSTSRRNFIYEEIELLAPDIIFTMNIRQYFNQILQSYPPKLNKSEDSLVDCYKIELNGKSVLLVDTYHFSAVMKEREKFFLPIQNAIKEVIDQFKFT